MSNKIAILHFNVLEKYPPVMNFIFDALEANPAKKILVFTTKNTTSYKTPHFPNTKIYRFGTISSNSFKRYATYMWFNLMSSIVLLINRVDNLTVFESLSIIPLWVVSKIYSSDKCHIHFHEYISEPERIKSSVYIKVLFKLENQLLKKYHCSHTNEDRKRLFLIDKPFLNSDFVEVRPNLPPRSWWNEYGQFKKKKSGTKIKLVYVGSCDNRTMYVKEVLDWVNANQLYLDLTIISQQLDNETKKMILDYNCPSISILRPIDYYELPKEQIKYDVGLVLYKGHVPNYIYNVPNKVYEYLSCGLKVLAPDTILSIQSIKNNQILIFDFSDLNSIELTSIISSNEIFFDYKHMNL